MAFTHGASHGQLTIDSVDLMSPCFRVVNLHELFGTAQVRGGDVTIPKTPGRKARRRRRDATEYTLRLHIVGDVDGLGDPFADHVEGLTSNCNVLANLADPPTGDGTVAATFSDPAGDDRTGSVHVLQFVPGSVTGPGSMTATLTISIPAGQLTTV